MSRHLLLAVTGGIASGKSTVSDMLSTFGSPVVDADVIARMVVEPGKPSWMGIVGYFGEEILQEDGYLDRRKLSDIVFYDPEKRKVLENFTHPYISKEASKQISKIIENDPDAIIQVVIPLLIEVGHQHRYHKTLLVYVSEETQTKRLISREIIKRDEAIMRLRAQIPIDEKVKYADFVIHNEHSLEETRRQVEHVWQTLRKIQEKG